MNDWADLVTTALLGTGRRPLPAALPPAWAIAPDAGADDPAVRVLDLAARHRAVVRADPTPFLRLSDGSADERAPAGDRRPAPDAATQLLGDLLFRPVPDLINGWLAQAAAAGCGVPAVHWTRLARLAAHSSAYDRPLLGRVLGARGRWFLEQNPEWRRLASDCASVPDRPPSRPAQVGPSPETVRGKPMAVFDHPDPWPDDVVAAAFAVLGSAALGRKARDYASRVGARLPVRNYRSVAAAAEYYLLAPEATPAQRRLIKESFVIVEQAAYARVQIERAFAPDPSDPSDPSHAGDSGTFRRLAVPGV